MVQAPVDPAADGGTAEPNVREQLIAVASDHFSKYGYAKTTLADLAKEIGFSKTYFYRLFKSKQEIGEAICSQVLGTIILGIEAEIAGAGSASERLRKMLRTIASMGVDLFFEDRKLYDIAAVSSSEKWGSSVRYLGQLEVLLHTILVEGRAAGEFERKTPLDEAVRAIMLASQPFVDPRALEYNLDLVPDATNEVVSLILRSLAP
ncbi:TetR/AcrR family transcriptional regulator [Sphingomonas sp. QA11]|uniref:TetR/AcrR family transcriptional regulator n=1 Tax=Sphingomonas sp. QA11 TaxID=2950605 RepID=UPI00234A0B87|nr:TetR/AcrR family transcriptional regulator [Sphingomonas sp. QA11]WCM25849.1 TetR/AcrR family transcriptional regulator [Sphingomonas sp. QA11]